MHVVGGGGVGGCRQRQPPKPDVIVIVVFIVVSGLGWRLRTGPTVDGWGEGWGGGNWGGGVRPSTATATFARRRHGGACFTAPCL